MKKSTSPILAISKIRKDLKRTDRKTRYWFFVNLCCLVTGKPPVECDHYDLADVFLMATDKQFQTVYKEMFGRSKSLRYFLKN